MIEIRPATAADVLAFFGRSPQKTMQAVVVIKDGELSAFAGVTIERNQIIAFSDVKDGVRVPNITVWRCAKAIMKYIRGRQAPVFAIASPDIPRSGRFLQTLGFTYVGPCESGNVYRLDPWQS